MHDKNGTPLAIGDRIILTGTILEFTSDQPTYCNITVELSERMAPDCVTPTTLGIPARQVIKGELNDRVSGPVIVRAMQAAKYEIERLQRQLADVQNRAQAREDVLQATVVRLHRETGGNRYPDGLNGCAVASDNVTGHLEALITAIQTPPAPADRKLSSQEAADIEFQAGRNCARNGQEMLDEASPAAREGYEYEKKRAAQLREQPAQAPYEGGDAQ